DHITANFKGLMNGRRLMHSTGDRFEILGVECERIYVAVPTDDIERMMSHRYAGLARAVLNQDFRVLFLIDCIELSRAVKIALRIRRPHFDLAFLIQITLRNSHRTA